MKKLIFSAAGTLCFLFANAQQIPKAPSMPDVARMMKMSPAELEAYKKKLVKEAADYAASAPVNVDVSVLPDHVIKPPVKDVARLAALPSQPPTRAQLVSSVQQSMSVVKKGIPAPRLAEIDTEIKSISVESIHNVAVASFYKDDPRESIYLMMNAVSSAPDSILMVNNLAAMMNISGVPHKAVPLLQYCLERAPQSSMVLNNIGQSYFALGDALKAAAYFNQCLSIDSLNVEANHSMGMLHYFKKEYDKSMEYFNRELSVAYRRSTMAMAYKMGRKFNLRELARRRNKRNGRPQKDHFEEITLGRFSFPSIPSTYSEFRQRKPELENYAASVSTERQVWMNNALAVNQRYTLRNGEEHPGLYSNLVDEMLKELHEEFTPEFLHNYSDKDAKEHKAIMDQYITRLIGVQCPVSDEYRSIDVQDELAVKCCEDSLRPLFDKMAGELAAHVQPKIFVAQTRWKSYINQLVAIAQLDPSPSNQMLVYNAVGSYFNFLAWGCLFHNGSNGENFLVKCSNDYDPERLDSLMEAERNWQLDCPKGLNLEVNFGGPVLKVDCNKFQLEIGEAIMAGFEHEFKSGKSTLLVGPGVKGSFLGVKAEMKNQVFISFDNNKTFSDFGIKSSLEAGISGTPLPLGPIQVGGNLAGVETSSMVGINSGHKIETEYKGAAARIFGE